MAPLRMFPSDDARLRQTVDAIWRGLTHNGWLMRYRDDDGLGATTVAFVLCTFWLIEALVLVDRQDEARVLMDQACRIQSPLGLIAEDFDMRHKVMSGNFPQAYSHVGIDSGGVRRVSALARRLVEVVKAFQTLGHFRRRLERSTVRPCSTPLSHRHRCAGPARKHLSRR